MQDPRADYRNNLLVRSALPDETEGQARLRKNQSIDNNVLDHSIEAMMVLNNPNALMWRAGYDLNRNTISAIQNASTFYMQFTNTANFAHPSSFDYGVNEIKKVLTNVDRTKKNTFIISAYVGNHFETYAFNTDGEVLITKSMGEREAGQALAMIKKAMQDCGVPFRGFKLISEKQLDNRVCGPLVVNHAMTIDPNKSLFDSEQERQIRANMVELYTTKQGYFRDLLYQLSFDEQVQAIRTRYHGAGKNVGLHQNPAELAIYQQRRERYMQMYSQILPNALQSQAGQNVSSRSGIDITAQEFYRRLNAYCSSKSGFQYVQHDDYAVITTPNATYTVSKIGSQARILMNDIPENNADASFARMVDLWDQVSPKSTEVKIAGGTSVERLQAFNAFVARGHYVEYCDPKGFSPQQLGVLQALQRQNQRNYDEITQNRPPADDQTTHFAPK